MVQVSMILSDPKTTNDPMMAWVVNKQQVGHKAIYVRYVYIFVQLCFSSNTERTDRQSRGSNFSVLSLDLNLYITLSLSHFFPPFHLF